MCSKVALWKLTGVSSVENTKTITLEIVEISRDWKIKMTAQEKAGICSTTVGLHADSLEKAKELADRLVANEHSCDGLLPPKSRIFGQRDEIDPLMRNSSIVSLKFRNM